MIVNDQKNVESILSEEGSTQGDVSAMQMYAIGIRPLIDILHEKSDNTKCQQVWYADDSSSAGKLSEIRHWWDILNETGPKFGYFPKASKTILIVKNEDDEEMANTILLIETLYIKTLDRCRSCKNIGHKTAHLFIS